MRSRALGVTIACLFILASACTEVNESPDPTEPVDATAALDVSEDVSDASTEPDLVEPEVTEPEVVEPEVVEGCDDPTLVSNTKDVLERSCYPCHGLLGQSNGGIGYILDADALISNAKVKPGDPEDSRVYIRMAAGTMPPVDTAAPVPTEDEIALVGAWISCGAPALYEEEEREFVPPGTVLASIRTDLESLPESQRQFARYLSLVNLYNSGVSSNDLKAYRNGLAKMVNSLSLGSDIVNPVSINDEDTIYRIFIDDYGWDYNPTQTVDIWESIVREYPYGIRYENETADQNIEELTGTKMAYVNADWFVATASQPRLYHVILQLPNSEKGLEQMVGVDTAANIATHADGLRAGFKQSGVSNSNRIIERHDANMGMYWKSFDFATEAGQGNIMTYSLGPPSPEFTEEQNAQLFNHDGGEFIFALPNGLHAYMITTADGCRLDVAPTEIVDSPTQPNSAVIENGYSCMFCHREGIIPGIDGVRANWEQFGPSAPQYAPDGPLNGQEYVDEVYEIYVPEAEMTAAQDGDRDDYKEALEATGSVFGEYDPVSLLKFEFDEDMTGDRVAAELGVTLEQLDQLVLSNPSVNLLIGSALTATVSRDVFESSFAEVVCALYLGDPLQHDEACGDDCAPDCGDAVCGDHDGCGGSCGDCDAGHECVAGACYALCGVDVIDLCEGVECDDGVDCTADLCDPATGECVSTPDDGLCADEDLCNGAEICNADTGCEVGVSVVVDDGVACTVDACDGVTGEVSHTADDTLCDDADPCTGVETCDVDNDCQAGTLVDTDDQIACTVDACDPATGEVSHTADDAACDDTDICTVDVCGAAGCTNDAVVCNTPPADTCNGNAAITHVVEGTCDAVEGCQYVANDPVDCGEDVCTDGACVSPAPVCEVGFHDGGDGVCVAEDSCSAGFHDGGDGVCVADGLCSAGFSDDGAGTCVADSLCANVVCDTPPANFCDGNAAVTHSATGTCDDATGECDFAPTPEDCVAGTCTDGTCISSELCAGVDCDDQVACTVDQCDPNTGQCLHNVDDTACADGDVCNGDETCDLANGCQVGTPLVTDDDVACTVDACDAVSGVSHTPDDTLCADADVCNGAEVCDAASGCQGGTPLDTDDGVACTVDACDASSGVSHTPDDAACDDQDACTTDTCTGAGCANDAVVCDTPPSPTCNGNVLEISAAVGSCAAGACTYGVAESLDCSPGTCSNGGCSTPADPCLGVVCNTPPAASCAGNSVVQPEANGSCVNGSCEYAEALIPCTGVDVCQSGTCVASCADACQVGDVGCQGDTTFSCATGASGCLEVVLGTDCAANNEACNAGVCECVSTGNELCGDGIDNDCDSATDEQGCSIPCSSGADCDDGNPCTADNCAGGICVPDSVAGCCLTNEDCAGEAVCNNNVCESPCLPQCDNKGCWESDGCGGSCQDSCFKGNCWDLPSLGLSFDANGDDPGCFVGSGICEVYNFNCGNITGFQVSVTCGVCDPGLSCVNNVCQNPGGGGGGGDKGGDQ